MKSAKLAVLAVLAVSLTAGGLPAQDYTELPDPAATAAPGGGAASTLPPTSPAQEPADGATAATVPATPEAAGTEPAQPTAPADTEPGESEEQQDDEGFEPVVGGGFPVPGPNTPMVTDPDGTVRSAVETDISAVHDHGASTFSARNGGASTAGAAARSGTIKVTLVFATLTDNRNGVDQNAARGSVVEANKYWRAMSNNRLGMSIVAERSINSTANSGQDYADMMNTIRRDLNWYEDPDEALVVFVPAGDLRSGGYGGILGGGWTSGPTSGSVLMPRPSGFTNNVVTHELGHVLGLLHANSLKCNNGRADVGLGVNGAWGDGSCTSREYGDTSDLMGYAQYPSPTISSFFWDQGGFGRGDEIYDAGSPGSATNYTLRAWAGSASNRAVKFRDTSGETYYLELRLPVGYDASTAVGGNRGVKIVKRDLANNWALNSLVVAPNTRDFAGYTNANSTWQAGQTFTTHAGTTVRINSVSGDSASITITGGAAARAIEPIAQARAAHPELGAAISDVIGGIRDNGAYRNFANGAILWSPATGAQVSVKGAVRDAYQSSGFEGGPLGFPTSGEMVIPGGKYQNFQYGAILWSPAGGAQVSANGAIRDAYQRSGFEGGPLGYPTSGEVAIPGGKFQNFANGAILWSAAGGAQVSANGAVRDAYQRSGFEGGPLGFPTSGEMVIPGGKYQNFANGAILWSPAGGAQVSANGAVRDAYQRSGFEGGPLGYPTSGEMVIPGGKYQNFANGAILWSPAGGAQVSANGAIRDAYQKSGFEGGPLGYPTSGEVAIPGGKFQNFANGAILWSPAGGAQVSANGSIRDLYQKSGFEGGPLGYPTSGEISANGGKYQNFANGAILWSPATGAQVSSNGSIRDAYQKSGSVGGPLGYPTSGEVPIPGGKFQNFANGAILWSAAGGAQVSANGAIRDAYQRSGFEGGPLGYPTSGEVSANGGKYQNFANGAILWSPATGAQVSSNGPVRDAYQKSGFETGPLGYPTSGEMVIPGGKYQNYANGAILWSPTGGAQVSANGPIRDAYRGQGFEGGRLGYPTSGEYAVGKTRVQDFKGGQIILDADGKAAIRYN
ncbi:hypothetical protein [Arthrobacter sp. zg-Y877]|uniref:hypothetical protein n=1 Tax=Arthrobacter sp. zg-Y877 TaxID=3049074 RepID=UPI0025A33E72|nr:hypothetical protein [Arthrobacter sp. zg-Y877]MDM7989527.1 hypothetical protein [Arthrobacter sp. zg-Y877]